jgi:hypothetical protein
MFVKLQTRFCTTFNMTFRNYHHTTFHIPSSNPVELGWNAIKGPEYFVLLYASVVLTEEYNFTVNSEQLIGATEYLMQQMSCHITLCLHTLIS